MFSASLQQIPSAPPRTYVGSGIPASAIVVPVASYNGSLRYVNFLTLNGAVAGRINPPSNKTERAVAQRYGNVIQYGGHWNVTLMETLDLTTWVGTNSHSLGLSVLGDGLPVRTKTDQMLRINPVLDFYQVMDMTGGSGVNSYDAGTATGISETHTAVSFYARAAAGLSSFSSTVLWTSSYNNGTFQGEVWRASYNSSTEVLGSRNSVSSNDINNSRNQAGTCSATLAYMVRFDDKLYRCSPSSSYITAVTVPAITYGGNSYTFSFGAATGNTGAALPNGKLVAPFVWYDGTRFRTILGLVTASSGTTASVVFVCELEDAYSSVYGCYSSVAVVPVNESGFFAVGFLEAAYGGMTAGLKVFNATAGLVASSQGIPLGAAYAGSTDIRFSPLLNCEWEKLLAGSATS